MNKIIIFCFFAVCTATVVFTQNVQYTKRSRNEVREGPANYYDLLKVLPAGVKIIVQKTEGSWLSIKTPDASKGWMSKNCLIETKPGGNEGKELSKEWASPDASKAAIAAAIRGFAQRFGSAGKGDVNFLESLDRPFFTEQDFRAFIMTTLNQTETIPFDKLGDDAEKFFGEFHFETSEEGIGAGIAARVAARGLVNNAELNRYVNLVGEYLVQSSPVYDVYFRFYILNEPQATAFSVPGGYIFISKGLLELCTNEAQLAGVISHELMHVILHHGIKEMHARENETKMDNAFSELESEAKSVEDTSEEALGEFAREAWETVNKPRTIEMEKEADKGAALLMAHAGYDPKELESLILKIEANVAVSVSTNIEEENPFAYMDFKQRREYLHDFINERLSFVRGKTFEARLNDHKNK